MHDHDPFRSKLMVRTSPPRLCEFTSNSKANLKQQHQQSCHHHHSLQQQQHEERSHNQMHHQHYLQQQRHSQPQQENHLPHSQFSKFGHFTVNKTSLLPSSSLSAVASDDYSVDEFEDVDEDQISDLDEEEELRLSYEQYRLNFHRRQPDVTSQLLEFADMVSADIRKFFGRTSDQEDSCDVYEDKWVTAKSGRELYYADLLRIAQGGDTDTAINKTTKKSPSSLSSLSSSSLSHDLEFDNRSRFTGRRNDSAGMGPLSELFESGFSSCLQYDHDRRKSSVNSKSKATSSQTVSRSHKLTHRVVPMFERKFPESFWREPCAHVNGIASNCFNKLESSQHNMLSSSKLPDFSDLVESWQGGIEGMATTTAMNKGDSAGSIETEHHRL